MSNSEIKTQDKKLMSWEDTIIHLRSLPEHAALIYDSYLGENLVDNCKRFASSAEFHEILQIISETMPGAKKILDLAAGNGIAAYAFAKSGFDVTALDPDPSATVGRGAIEIIKANESLGNLTIIDGFGESIPVGNNTFDVVYLRQALHHARNLHEMVGEIYRVLKPGGIFIATREHVVDNYDEGMKAFLDSQVDHQLYGGENAFTLEDYLKAIKSQKFVILKIYDPFDSDINMHPGNVKSLHEAILASKKGKLLKRLFGKKIAINLVLRLVKRNKVQGRIYSFVSRKKINT